MLFGACAWLASTVSLGSLKWNLAHNNGLLHQPPVRCKAVRGVTRQCQNRHLAAAEGCFSVVEWLLKEAGADPNPIDRFNRTPLEVCRILLAVSQH